MDVTWSTYRADGFVLVGRSYEKNPSKQRITDVRCIKIAAIDLNQTLIVSKSGSIHGDNEHDWKWSHESVPRRLQELHTQGYTILITSNQGRLTYYDGSEAQAATPFKRKMELIMRELGVPVTLLVACANDIYRKPRPGLWSVIPALTGNDGCDISKAESIIVGDAAGRENDFSDSDVHWAMNAGIPFETPEVFFRGEAPGPLGHKFHPEWHLGSNGEGELNVSKLQDSSLVVLVGLPGAGKTTSYRRVLRFHGFVRRDARSYNSRENFILAIEKGLQEGFSIVVDDLNIDVQSRRVWLELAAKQGLTIDALYFDVPTDLCLHNDSVRALGGPLMNLEDRPVYPRLEFLELVPQIQKPVTNEGFRDVQNIQFKWSGTDEELKVWRKFWF